MSSTYKRIGIAGAGLMGRLLAWQLRRRGHEVSIFEAGSDDGGSSAAYVAAAMLAPYSEAVSHGAEVFDTGRNAVAQWRTLLGELKADTGTSVRLQDTGSVVIAHDLDRANLQHFSQKLNTAVGNDAAVHKLDRSGIAALEPELPENFRQGLWLEGEGSLDNRGLLLALGEALKQAGVRWQSNKAALEVRSGELVFADGSQSFDWAVDCRGLGAKVDWPDVRGVRGEVLWVRASEVSLSRPVRLMHPRYSLYITPKPNDIYVIGATEIESESQAPPTVRSELELLSALYSVHSGFAEAQIVHSFARCRPALPDNLPRVQAQDGILRVNGLYRHGYLLSPTILDVALRALEGERDLKFLNWLESDDQNQRQQRA